MSQQVAIKHTVSLANIEGAAPKIDVLSVIQTGADVAYLVRVREDWGTRQHYHIKRMTDFQELDDKLRKEVDKRASPIKLLPNLPAKGSLMGVRSRLSSLGLSPFLDNQLAGIQAYCDGIAVQLPSLSADSLVQHFFEETNVVSDKDQSTYVKLVQAAMAQPTLKTIVGKWTIDDGPVWEVFPEGKVTLNGTAMPADYKLYEVGEGIDRILERGDGWTVDLAKSTDDTLYWSFRGQIEEGDLIWKRVKRTSRSVSPVQRLSSVLTSPRTSKATGGKPESPRPGTISEDKPF